MSIRINLNKAKNIAHEMRRIAREKEFKPWDDIITKQIPGNDLKNAENERQKIRTKYDYIQVKIDNAKNIDELKIAIVF